MRERALTDAWLPAAHNEISSGRSATPHIEQRKARQHTRMMLRHGGTSERRCLTRGERCSRIAEMRTDFPTRDCSHVPTVREMPRGFEPPPFFLLDSSLPTPVAHSIWRTHANLTFRLLMKGRKPGRPAYPTRAANKLSLAARDSLQPILCVSMWLKLFLRGSTL